MIDSGGSLDALHDEVRQLRAALAAAERELELQRARYTVALDERDAYERERDVYKRERASGLSADITRFVQAASEANTVAAEARDDEAERIAAWLETFGERTNGSKSVIAIAAAKSIRSHAHRTEVKP